MIQWNNLDTLKSFQELKKDNHRVDLKKVLE